MTEEQLRTRVISQDKIIDELTLSITVKDELIDQLLKSNHQLNLALATYQIEGRDEG